MAGTDFFIRPASGTSSSDWLRLPNADISVAIIAELLEQYCMVERAMTLLMKEPNQLSTRYVAKWILKNTKKS